MNTFGNIAEDAILQSSLYLPKRYSALIEDQHCTLLGEGFQWDFQTHKEACLLYVADERRSSWRTRAASLLYTALIILEDGGGGLATQETQNQAH